ncbi:hypothetical protein ABW19_dt0210269 [Dactylella cylindrospora]|nr:hypothetical protein ABW19_dt0210269 [Dactylella cylindrospora]
MASPTHLVLATTRDIFKLPRRLPPGLDGAIIVPLPPPPRTADSDNESEDEDEDMEDRNNDDDEEEEERMEIDAGIGGSDAKSTAVAEQKATSTDQSRGNEGNEEDEADPTDYTLLLSSIRDRKPCIIRREDGFEKRLLWRCGRCRLIFGYQIDDDTLDEQGRGKAEGSSKRGGPKKNYYVYILPGGLTTASDMGTLKESDIQLIKED